MTESSAVPEAADDPSGGAGADPDGEAGADPDAEPGADPDAQSGADPDGEEAAEGISVAEAVRLPDPEPTALGDHIYRERQRTATLQRVLTARSGVSQPNIAAYERGRRQPTWSVFVRLINAMGRRPVLTTEPLKSPAELRRRAIKLEWVVQEVLEVVGDRAYRFEHNAAARLLGLDLPIDFVHVSVVGDPDRLDELAIRAVTCDRSRDVMTHRGPRIKPQVHFFAALATVALEVIAAPRDSVVVVLDGRQVHVAPMEQLRVKPLL